MYSYYKTGSGAHKGRNVEAALALSRERARPSSANPDKVILSVRQNLFRQWLSNLSGSQLDVLDIGGRIQPYRHLVDDRARKYVAADVQLEGLVDVIAAGESLPFADSSFDLVVCTQVLGYASDPGRFINEARRVVRPGGAMFLSAPAFFPEHHDERWRFLPGGLRLLFEDWEGVEIVPEGNSAVGALRVMAIKISQSRRALIQFLARKFIVPGINRLSFRLMRRNASTDTVANYSVWATR